MPNLSAYSNLGKAFSGAHGTGIEARKSGIGRRGSSLLFEEKQRQRQNMFNTLYQAIGLGSNLYDVYSGNADMISYAEEAGCKTESNWLENLFGDTEFSKDGVSYTGAELSARKLLGVE